MIAGAIGGGVCILAGLVSLLLGLLASQATFGSTIPPGLYWALGLYFIGKGCFAAGISFTTGWSSQQKATTASGPSPTPSAP
jgi:hypothetical protein